MTICQIVGIMGQLAITVNQLTQLSQNQRSDERLVLYKVDHLIKTYIVGFTYLNSLRPSYIQSYILA